MNNELSKGLMKGKEKNKETVKQRERQKGTQGDQHPTPYFFLQHNKKKKK